MRRLWTLTLLVPLAVPGLAASDWPQFLGPRRDGTSEDGGLATAWEQAGRLRERWRVPVGVGYSGLAVVAGRLYGMDSVDGDEYVFARRAEDGRELWRVRTAASPADVYGGLGPRVTPSVAGGRVFTVAADGHALCLEAANGAMSWRRSLRDELGWRPPAEGTAASPLVKDGRVYLMNGGADGRAFVAMDAASGRTLWAAQDDSPSYASPVAATAGGLEQALFLGGTALFSVDPASGRLLWRYPWPTMDRVNAASPLSVSPDHVFISSGHDQGAALLKVVRDGGRLRTDEVWRNREMRNHFNNSVAKAGVLYGFDNSLLKAVDLETGAPLWRERGYGKGSLVLLGHRLLVLSEDGALALLEPGRTGVRELARQAALRGRTWTPPSIAGGRVYLRGLEELVALEP